MKDGGGLGLGLWNYFLCIFAACARVRGGGGGGLPRSHGPTRREGARARCLGLGKVIGGQLPLFWWRSPPCGRRQAQVNRSAFKSVKIGQMVRGGQRCQVWTFQLNGGVANLTEQPATTEEGSDRPACQPENDNVKD